MSFKAISWAVNQDTGCSGTKLVLIQLCNYANDSLECYPSITHLSEKCCCSKSSVTRYIRKLKKLNIITVKKIGKGLQKHNHYTIKIPSSLAVKLTHNTNINNNNKFFRQKGRNKNFIAG
tara:strand:- start:138 stop:497 length:360 start_codon:yes stop_codon:yes gene_type:complete